MKLPAIDLQGTLGKVPGLSKFIKPKAGASGAARGKAAQAKSHEQQVQQRLDLTMKGLGGLATVLVLFALYSVFAQSGLNKAIHNAAPPMVDLSELVATHGGKGASGKGDHAKEAKAANNAKLKLPEGTDPRIDYAFEQIANFENTRSEAVLRSTRANVAGVAPGSVAARAGFRVGDFILSIDGDQAGFVWDSLRKLTAAGKSSVLLEVQRGNEVLRGELLAPEGELLTSTNTGLLFEIPEGYRFIGENDRRELRGGFSRVYMEGLAGDERLAYATSLALLGGNLVKRGVEQADLKPSDPMWLKTEQILADHHSKFSKALAHHGAVLETMQANLQAGFVKIGALLLAALIAGIAALASALQLNKHLSEQGIGAMRAQFQGLRSQMDQLAHAQAAMSASGRDLSATGRASTRQSAAASTRSSEPARDEGREPGVRGSDMSSAVAAGAAAAAGLSLAELAARVALSSDADDDKASDADKDKASKAGVDEGHDVLVQVDALGGADSTEAGKEALVASNSEAEHAVSAGGADAMARADLAAAPSTDTTAVGEAQAALAPGQEAAAASGPETEAVAQAAASSDAASDQTVSATDQVVNANASRTGDGANS
ncbi:MAG: PDZ domain-containing protein [Burkholderiaceae bacterium]